MVQELLNYNPGLGIEMVSCFVLCFSEEKRDLFRGSCEAVSTLTATPSLPQPEPQTLCRLCSLTGGARLQFPQCDPDTGRCLTNPRFSFLAKQWALALSEGNWIRAWSCDSQHGLRVGLCSAVSYEYTSGKNVEAAPPLLEDFAMHCLLTEDLR